MNKPWPTTDAPARSRYASGGSGGWPRGGPGAAWSEEAPTQEGTPEPRCAMPAQGHHSGQPVGGHRFATLAMTNAKPARPASQRTQFDFQGGSSSKGLPIAMRDVFDNEATIEYDDYQLLPVKVTDPVGMETSSEYDYRLLQPERVTDPNLNISTFAFTPLGLMHKTALLGKGDNSEGDTLADPGVLLEYDLFAFKDSGAPVWVKTTQRVHHINADYLSSLPTEEQDATIVAVEYSDGFGRQLQTRTQAEDLRFGDALLGDSGLPADQGLANAPAVGTLRNSGPLNVVVSGAKLYNNKGEVVEQWEPYFGTGFDLTDPTAQHGQRVRIYFDALGRPKRTVNPDGTEQRVVYGVPNLLNTPDSFKPSPWERYTYDANDLAPITHPGNTLSASHHWTPKSELIDALGHTVRTVEHITTLLPAGGDMPTISVDDVVMRYSYDIKGQLLEVRDPLDRVCFEHKYDTAGNNLWTKHLDSGEKTLVVDAQGKPLYSSDAKGAAVYTAYDDLHRPTDIWAKDASAESVTLRQHMLYGDSAGLTDPHLLNLNGQLVTHYDEAGKATITGYDFKGNPLEKVRQVIADSELTATEKYVVDWDGLAVPLDAKEYVTGLLYDGLNRVRKSILPEDVDEERKEMVPTYNRAGALEAITFDGIPYVHHIAYNAKGQRVLLAMGNGMMTRYAYDALNYRLLRIRSEKYDEEDHEYEPDGGVQQDLGYLYDLAGNIVGIRDKAPATSTTVEGPGDLLKQFAYDPLNRLLSATGRESTQAAILPTWDVGVRNHNHAATNTYTRTYQFDKLGNVLQEQHTADGNASNSFTKTFQYHATQEHNKLLSFTVGGTTYTQAYDANGNLITENTERHHQWGYDDKLKFFKIDAGGGASKWAQYQYDTGGTRVKKVVNKGGGIQEVTICIDGVFEECYVKESGTIDPDKHWNTLHVLDGNSRLVTVRVGEDEDDDTPPVKYNLEDHLGNSSVMVDAAGGWVNREEYYPFGDTSFGAFAKKRYRYNGKEKDGESGLYNYGMRYYAPWMCKFVSVDPLAGEYPHYTPYQYAGNKPINFIDRDGLEEDLNTQPSSQNSEMKNVTENKSNTNSTSDSPEYTGLALKIPVAQLPKERYVQRGDGSIEVTNPRGDKNLLGGIKSIKVNAGDNTTWQFTTIEDEQYNWNNPLGVYVKNESNMDPGTNKFPMGLHRGTTYAGEGGPMKMNDQGEWESDYTSLPPMNKADEGGFHHDMRYEEIPGAEGPHGTMMMETIPADSILVEDMRRVIEMHRNNELDPWTGYPVSKRTSNTALIMGLAFKLQIARRKEIQRREAYRERQQKIITNFGRRLWELEKRGAGPKL